MKKVTYELSDDAAAFVENMAKLLNTSPSNIVEHLLCVYFAGLKQEIEKAMPHADFKDGGFVNPNINRQ